MAPFSLAKWWTSGVTLPARRSCKDHLHSCAWPFGGSRDAHRARRPAPNWWSDGVTLPARRSCKDQLHTCARPMVPGRGFEPRSPVLQTGAVTRSAFRARAFSSEVDTGSRQENAFAQESGADAGNRNRAFGVALRNSTVALHPHGGKWRESNFRPAKGRRLRRRDGTSRP